MLKDLLYVIPKEKHSQEDLKEILTNHPEIKFVSLVGIDLSGNDTDERIPMKIFMDDISGFLKGAIQTDGSSVVLPGIATLNNAKVDMIADTDVNWFVDYNFELMYEDTNRPVGTLRIPCFLIHEGNAVDSRHILKAATTLVKDSLFDSYKKYPELLSAYNATFDDVDDVVATAATELEFWVKTPDDKAEVQELFTSQFLQEQYWTRTKGAVRSALEETLLLMEAYGLEPEMGHKEVGGVKAHLTETGDLTHVMEQLEIDWKYADAVQAADNELFVRSLVKETFRRYGLDVTFLAKPINGVAGSGEHTHLSIALKLKNGKRFNLYASTNSSFLSIYGYGSLMGILKNYEVINPIVSATNDSLRRLKPGFEAPVCIVTSLGHSVEVPSRNRTILLGVIRDLANPLSTRFELRAPNPFTNTYLALAALFTTSMDGINYAIENKKTEDALLAELSKSAGEDAAYLEKDRAYRSEEDVFEDFTDEERSKLFGKAPATVYENTSAFGKYPEKVAVLKAGDVFTEKILNSFRIGVERRWLTEINSRIVSDYANEIRGFKKLHSAERALDLDVANWEKINALRLYLLKDTYSTKSLFTRISDATEAENYDEVSNLQIELDAKMKELRDLYISYRKNLIDIE
ncbi:glutamine synthetase [Clostridiaceae bacterium UIB06]|uniref:Glutamine synthetase n=1 Tax=Clostridium thailandense TaxID=2794346 RepID=A0A949TXD1_9CLOT|nr:glutamine synthetase [Clostridium thailandense]MBV7273295.1 glutamine synthetase [Clostridium thailandense]MCH5137320.1 glutamine synthetase [Clostridiaceae bacterium UIB06]